MLCGRPTRWLRMSAHGQALRSGDVVEGERGQGIGHLAVPVQQSAFDQNAGQRGGEGLGQRGEAEHGVAADRLAGARVGEADAAFQQHAVVLDDRGGQAGDFIGRLHAVEPAIEFARHHRGVLGHVASIGHRNYQRRRRRDPDWARHALLAMRRGSAFSGGSGFAAWCRGARFFLRGMLRRSGGLFASGAGRDGKCGGQCRKKGDQGALGTAQLRSPGPVTTRVLCSNQR